MKAEERVSGVEERMTKIENVMLRLENVQVDRNKRMEGFEENMRRISAAQTETTERLNYPRQYRRTLHKWTPQWLIIDQKKKKTGNRETHPHCHKFTSNAGIRLFAS